MISRDSGRRLVAAAALSILAATGRDGEARPFFARAFALLAADTSPGRPAEARLARLERLGR